MTSPETAADQATSQPSNPILDFVAGTVAGIAALVVGYPFDTVKVRAQTPSFEGFGNQNRKPLGTFRTITTIIREERVAGLFRGIGAPMLTLPILNGVVFSSYKLFMNLQLSSRPPDSEPTLGMIFLAGSGSGIVSSVLTTPIELVKIRQQSAQSMARSKAVPSAFSTALQIVRTEGVFRGLYRGLGSTALRDLGYGWYFLAYEATTRYFSPPRPLPSPSTSSRHVDHSSLLEEAEEELHKFEVNWGVLLLAGGIAGIAGWLPTFPFDLIKTRIQSTAAPSTKSSTAPANPEYRNIWTTTVSSYRAEGSRVFWRGLWPTLIRSIPVNMVTFATFEGVVRFLG